MGLSACKDNDPDVSGQGNVEDAEYVGKTVGNFSAGEWYPGGKLGTTDNVTAGCYEDETPAVEDNEKLELAFKLGEAVFERNFTDNTAPFKGLGPAYLRSSCIDCHPGYGHGKRQTSYPSTYGNGYLLAVYHPKSEGSNDGAYISEVTGMPQTLSNAPFLPPIDGSQIKIEWKHVTAMESGLPMKFPDGETYDLIFPEVTIPESAFNTDPKPTNYAVRLESTIGVIGTGLIDAIPQDSIIAQISSLFPAPTLKDSLSRKCSSASPMPSPVHLCRTLPAPTPFGTSPTCRAPTVPISTRPTLGPRLCRRTRMC